MSFDEGIPVIIDEKRMKLNGVLIQLAELFDDLDVDEQDIIDIADILGCLNLLIRECEWLKERMEAWR